MGRPKGLDAENLSKVKKALAKGLSVTETVELTGISLSSVKRYRKYLQAFLSH
ncbi:MAG: helix-turn-helix domain-containing protein [Janthinobacterium lividum]